MPAPKQFIFLDMDGVMVVKNNTILPSALHNLCRLMGYFPHTEVIFNSAWNIHPLGYMQDLFQESITAARITRTLVTKFAGQTASCAGGGGPIRDWLKTTGHLGCQWVAIDDSTFYPGMWGRLVHVNQKKGLNQSNFGKIAEALRHEVSPRRERHQALRNLTREAQRLRYQCSWLSDEDRVRILKEVAEEAQDMILKPDDRVLIDAALKEG